MINYVDLESVRFVDDHIYFWRLTDYTTLQKSPDPNVPEGYNSLAMYIKAGCKNLVMKKIHKTHHYSSFWYD